MRMFSLAFFFVSITSIQSTNKNKSEPLKRPYMTVEHTPNFIYDFFDTNVSLGTHFITFDQNSFKNCLFLISLFAESCEGYGQKLA